MHAHGEGGWNWQARRGISRAMTESAPPASLAAAKPFAAVVLAAGKGTRMKSDTHKVLHPIAGQPMLAHLLASVEALGPVAEVIVVGHGREQIEQAVAQRGARVATQEPQLGTGHAVQQAEAALDGFDGDILILYGDVPMVPAGTMARMLERLHADDAPAVVVLGFRPPVAGAYGRVIADGSGTIAKMVEAKDASPEEYAVTLCNSGLMAVRAADLWPLLARVGNDNAAAEYYLVDIVNLAQADGRKSAVIETEAWEVAGVNSRAELAQVEADWQQRRRIQAMADGVTLIAPETVWFAYDTVVGRDVTIEQNVVFAPGVTVADGALIRAFSHLEKAEIGAGALIGPYARLRPGAKIGARAHIGNFVEVKNVTVGEGAKANHLTYLGDGEVGAGANIGAGTIFCNYDGFFKYRTIVGEGAFVGSNSALVAPVTIGKGAIVAAGAVVTKDVAPEALALVRPNQEEKPGWATRFRARMSERKKAGG